MMKSLITRRKERAWLTDVSHVREKCVGLSKYKSIKVEHDSFLVTLDWNKQP